MLEVAFNPKDLKKWIYIKVHLWAWIAAQKQKMHFKYIQL